MSPSQPNRTKELLKKIYLFAKMEDADLEKLSSIASIHHYKKGHYLFMQGELSEHLLILIVGTVRVYKHDQKGNEIIIGLFKPYSMIAEPAILQRLAFPSSATFTSDGAVIKIALAPFETHFLRDGHISYEIIQSLLGKIQLLQQNIHANIAKTAQEKILNYYQNHTQPTTLKHYQIAALLGMSAETFSRKHTQLVKSGRLVKNAQGYEVAIS